MALFNFDKNAILGTVFKAASNVLSTASRALGSAARTSARASKAASSIGKSRPSAPPSTPSAAVPAPVKPIQVTGIEPPVVRPIAPDSDRPAPTIMPETITPDAATIGKLMAEIEKLKKERDFLLQAQQKESKPFGAAGVSSDAAAFEQQMDVAAAIDAKRAANPSEDEKELRQQAIDEYYYPEDEGEGVPDDYDELAGLEPGPIPF